MTTHREWDDRGFLIRNSSGNPFPHHPGGTLVTEPSLEPQFVDQLAELRRLGLSEYASRAYLALLDLGETDARSVSRLAKVPAAKIYQTLDHLNERGLVEVIPDSPRRYVPMPIKRYIDRMRRDHESAIRDLGKRESDITGLFPVKGDREIRDRGNHVVVRGRRNVMERMALATQTAREDLLMLATRGMPGRIADLAKPLQTAKDRGVRLRLLAHPEHVGDERLAEIFAISEVRIAPRIREAPSDTSIGLIDRSRAMVVHFVPDDDSRTNGQDVALLSDEQGTAHLLSFMLENLWETASPLEDHSQAKAAE